LSKSLKNTRQIGLNKRKNDEDDHSGMTEQRRIDAEEVRRRLTGLASGPALFLRDLDPVRDLAMFSSMTEESYRSSSFLNKPTEYVGQCEFAISLDVLLQLWANQSVPRRTIHYVFHVGHCGSTLMSRLLGELDGLFALREPPVLMGLSRSFRRLAEPNFPISRTRWESLKDLCIDLLGRTWRQEGTALVKPTSHANNLIPILMRHTGDEHAVFLWVKLETYLATMMRDETRRETQLFAKDFRIREFNQLAPACPVSQEGLSAGQMASLNWLLHAREMALAFDDAELAPRVISVRFEEYLRAPESKLTEIGAFLCQPDIDIGVAQVITEKMGRVNAKIPGIAYDASDRSAMLDASRRKYAKEIQDGLDWAHEVCDSCPAFAGLIDRFI
jgi:hypothetical protein